MNTLILLGLSVLSFFPSEVPVATESQDYCGIYGAIFVETDRKRADYLVYDQKNEAFADILVFKETSRGFADREGYWYFTKNRGMADFIIYYVKERGQAHFSVNFTETESLAGCQ